MMRRIRSLGRFQLSNAADSFIYNSPGFMRTETGLATRPALHRPNDADTVAWSSVVQPISCGWRLARYRSWRRWQHRQDDRDRLAQLYDRWNDDVSLNEVERILI